MILNHKQADFLLSNEGVFIAYFAKLATGDRNILNSWKGKEKSELDTLVLKKGNSKYMNDEKKTKFKKRMQQSSTADTDLHQNQELKSLFERL